MKPSQLNQGYRLNCLFVSILYFVLVICYILAFIFWWKPVAISTAIVILTIILILTNHDRKDTDTGDTTEAQRD